MLHTWISLLFIAGFMMTASADSGGKGSQGAGRELVRGADLVLLHGKIWTGEPVTQPGPNEGFGPLIEALAIAHGRFLAGGTTDEIRAYVGPYTRVIDLKGRLAVPGFIDSHTHFLSGGFELLKVDFKDARDEAEFLARLARTAKAVPTGQWITGGNWDEQAWPSAELPTRWLIDPVTPNHPVFISRYDGHSALANSLALKLAGVTKDTPQPEGGVIVRDAKTGEPTGVLKDTAQGLVERVITRETDEEIEAALKAGLAEARRVGVTTVENMASTAGGSAEESFTREVRMLRRAELEGWLTCRFYEITPIAGWKRLEQAGLSRGMGSEFLKLGAVKAFADGSLGSATAWMFEPFADDAGNRGVPRAIMNPPAKMEALARDVDQARIQIATHAIGDRAVAEMLDIYARLGGSTPWAHRFRIEHSQHVRAEDIERFGKLGVIASMQPYHAIDDGRWAGKRLDPKRLRTSYAWRSMLRARAPLAFGSDWPVAPLSPLLGIYAAVTRATLDGKNPDGWFPEERLGVDEALRAYTLGNAYAAFEENEKGSIATGKLADLVVLSDDLFTIPPEKIKEVRVVYSIVGGKVVYQAD